MKRLICLLIPALPFLVKSQAPPVKKYTAHDGLGHSVVYRIAQTRDGFLWFSTDDGLTRYDGKTFVNYTTGNGFPSGFIFGTLETDSSLLVSSFGAGVVSFSSYGSYLLQSDSNLLKYPIDLFRNKAGTWAIDRNSKAFRFRDGRFRPFLIPGMKKTIVFKMLETSAGELLMAGNYLYRYTEENGAVQLNIPGLPERETFSTLLELKDHRILTTTGSALYVITPGLDSARLLMKGNFYRHRKPLLQDNEGNILVATLNGELWLFSEDLGKKELLFNNIIINDIFQDNDNNIWLATYGRGLWCIPNLHVRVYATGRTAVTDLVLDKQHRQVVIADPHQGSAVLQQRKITPAGSRQPEVFRKSGITIVYCTEKGDYFSGGTETLLFRQHNDQVDSLFLNASVASIYKSVAGYYWVGLRTGPGLVKVHPDFKQVTKLTPFRGHIVRSVAEDDKGAILAGTDHGLYLQNGVTWQLLNHSHGLPDNYVNVVYSDQQRHCHWIGTNAGFAMLSQEKKIVRFNHPLAKLRCNDIVRDRWKNLWIGTTAGLIRYAQGKFSHFGEKDGMPSDIYRLVYDEQADKLYMLSPGELDEIQVAQFLQGQSRRIPAITVNNILADGAVISRTAGIHRLATSARYITLLTSLPSFKHQGKWSIYTRIGDQGWRPSEKPDELVFHRLPYGRFTIELKAMDNEGHTSPVVPLHFINPAPIYLNRVFLLFTGSAILLLVILFTRYVTQRNSRKKERLLLDEQQRLELEHKALLNMLNPHFMNNALNSIQTFVTRNDQRSTLGYLSRFAKLMRVNLELLETNSITLEKELQNVDLYLTFEKLRFSERLTYSIELAPETDPGRLMIPSLVMQPFVENAIWHGILPAQAPGHVSIRVFQQTNSLHIVIEDDGIGLEASQKRKEEAPPVKPSRGLKIIRDRFALLNKSRKGHSFTIEAGNNPNTTLTGTRVEIILPL